MASPAVKAAPSAVEIDLRAVEFHNLEHLWLDAKERLKAAGEPVDKLEKELIDWVRAYGGPHHEKSKILHGIAWEIMATFGQSMTQDSAAVERLRLELGKAKQARLLKKLFRKDIRWSFNSGAAVIIKGEKVSAKVKSLLLDCFVTSDRTPTLDVRKKKIAAGS